MSAQWGRSVVLRGVQERARTRGKVWVDPVNIKDSASSPHSADQLRGLEDRIECLAFGATEVNLRPSLQNTKTLTKGLHYHIVPE